MKARNIYQQFKRKKINYLKGKIEPKINLQKIVDNGNRIIYNGEKINSIS